MASTSIYCYCYWLWQCRRQRRGYYDDTNSWWQQWRRRPHLPQRLVPHLLLKHCSHRIRRWWPRLPQRLVPHLLLKDCSCWIRCRQPHLPQQLIPHLPPYAHPLIAQEERLKQLGWLMEPWRPNCAKDMCFSYWCILYWPLNCAGEELEIISSTISWYLIVALFSCK